MEPRGKGKFKRRWTKVNAAVRRKEAAWKDVFAASDEEAKERCMEAYRGEMIK